MNNKSLLGKGESVERNATFNAGPASLGLFSEVASYCDDNPMVPFEELMSSSSRYINKEVVAASRATLSMEGRIHDDIFNAK